MSEFIQYIKEVFSDFGTVEIKRMFGGYGVFYNQLMIGLIADEELYLKADTDTENHFIEMDLSQFEYQKKDRVIKMSYYQAPEIIFDDPQQATIWADRAYQAAAHSSAGKSRRKKSPL